MPIVPGNPVEGTEVTIDVQDTEALLRTGALQSAIFTGVLTEQAALQAALAESRKDQLRFKDEFLSHVSHELRSPLTAIKQFTSGLAAGAQVYVQKPWNDTELLAIIGDLLGQPDLSVAPPAQ